MRRGIKRERTVGNAVVYQAITSEGTVAWELKLDPTLYPIEQHTKILRLFERALLNPVDVPLSVVTGSNARVALPAMSLEDPYEAKKVKPALVK